MACLLRHCASAFHRARTVAVAELGYVIYQRLISMNLIPASLTPLRRASLIPLLGAACVLFCTSSLPAEQITLKLPGGLTQAVEPSLFVDIKLVNTTTNKVLLDDKNQITGRINWTIQSNSKYNGSLGAVGSPLSTFCIDITHNVTTGGKFTYNIDPPLGADTQVINGGLTQSQVDHLRELYGKYYFDAGTTNVKAAAFQLAIWDIVYNDTLIQNNGTLSGTPAFTFSYNSSDTGFSNANAGALPGQITTYLTDLASDPKAELLVLDSTSGNQNQLGLAAPEPSSLMLAGIGAAGLIGLARRRWRK
jgi:hypothetical protein